jgi:hypothetical protein
MFFIIGGFFERVLASLIVLIYCQIVQYSLESRLLALEAKVLNLKTHAHICLLLKDPDSEENRENVDALNIEALNVSALCASESTAMTIVKGAAILVIALVILGG